MKHERTGEQSDQDVATLRPGEGKTAERSEFQHAEADTVMFASVRAIPLANDALIARPTAEEASKFQIHPRRILLSRVVLLVILVMQVLLTVRMHNTVSPDEASTLFTGHAELAHLRSGTPLPPGTGPLPGAAMIAPLLGALAKAAGGLAAARAVSLLEMVFATALLYALTRKLFNERVALCAALVFAVAEPTLLGGYLAGYDATALFLLALAAWLAVRAPKPAGIPVFLLAAPVLVLASAAEYDALFFVPVVVMLAALAAWQSLGWNALVRMVVLGALTVAGLAGVAIGTKLDFRGGLTAPPPAGSGVTSLWDCAQWAGLPLLLVLIGAVAFAVRAATEGTEKAEIAAAGNRYRRVCLGALMVASALLGVALQLLPHTSALRQPVGFGLLLSAPMAGVGLVRVVGDHFRRTQIGIAVWAAVLAVGMTAANDTFHTWPGSARYVADLASNLRPDARYLVEGTDIPLFYLRNHVGAQPRQFTSIGHLAYRSRAGGVLTGGAADIAAIRAGYFRIVAYDYSASRAEDVVIARALAESPEYRLAEIIPNDNDLGRQYIWIKTG